MLDVTPHQVPGWAHPQWQGKDGIAELGRGELRGCCISQLDSNKFNGPFKMSVY